MRVHNVQSVSDISLRNVYQKASPDTQNMTMSNPRITSLSIRNLYNRFRQAPTALIKLLKPTVLSLALRNLYNKLDTQKESISISLPSIAFLEVRPLLQKLRTWGLDETFKVTLPNDIEIHKKDVVNLYINPDILEIKIDTPEPLEVEVKNILNKSTQRGPDFQVGIPDDIELGGSVKPVLTFPVLSGSVELGEVFNIDLKWQDESVTHTGYLLFRDTSPISVDTTLEPIHEFNRYVDNYEDWDLEEDTTYYYRVTPKSVYGRLFSNLLSLHVPLYLRAPHSFEVGFQGLTLPINGEGDINTLSKIWTTKFSFLSTEKASSISGEYAYQIFIEDPLHSITKVESPYGISGTSKLEHVLRGERSKYSSLQNTQDNFVEFFNDISLYGVETKLTKVMEPEKVDTSFAGITKGFIKSTFVILGSLIENRYQSFESITKTSSIVGHGSREMILHQPEAYILSNGVLTAITGEYEDRIDLRSGGHYYSNDGNIHDITVGGYDNPTSIIEPAYTYSPISKAEGAGAYTGDTHVGGARHTFLNYTVDSIDYFVDSISGVSGTNVYCILGSDAYDVECKFKRELGPYDILSSVSTLDIPRGIRTSTEEDQEFVLFSGYLPPVGYPLGFDTYRVDDYIIPVFSKQVIPGDLTRFTLYERMFKSKKVTSGYRPPNGVGIRFSLFIDEE